MKRISVLLSILFICMICISSIPLVYAADTTSITVRVCYYSVGQYPATTIVFERYTSMDSAEPYKRYYQDSEGRDFFANRSDLHQTTVKLEPGYYDIIVFPQNAWSTDAEGKTERFEVRGDIMTVYVACDTPDYPAPMPPEWLVYGEDNQNFSIWGSGSLWVDPEDRPTVSTTSDPENPGGTTPPESLPPENTSVEPIPDDSSATIPPDNSKIPERQNETESKSATIGTWIFTGFLILSAIVCGFILIRLRRKRGA